MNSHLCSPIRHPQRAAIPRRYSSGKGTGQRPGLGAAEFRPRRQRRSEPLREAGRHTPNPNSKREQGGLGRAVMELLRVVRRSSEAAGRPARQRRPLSLEAVAQRRPKSFGLKGGRRNAIRRPGNSLVPFGCVIGHLRTSVAHHRSTHRICGWFLQQPRWAAALGQRSCSSSVAAVAGRPFSWPAASVDRRKDGFALPPGSSSWEASDRPARTSWPPAAGCGELPSPSTCWSRSSSWRVVVLLVFQG
jgi:hypothetical protein